jgi:hypothetical protein
MDKKFCYACQVSKPVEDMHLTKNANGSRRWKCTLCIQRASVSKYQNKQKKQEEPND